MNIKYWVIRDKEPNFPGKLILKTKDKYEEENENSICLPLDISLDKWGDIEPGEVRELTLVIPQAKIGGKSKALKNLKVKYDLIGWAMRASRNDKVIVETNYPYDPSIIGILEEAFPDFYDHFKVCENTEGYLMIQAKDAWFSCPAGSSEFNQNKP